MIWGNKDFKKWESRELHACPGSVHAQERHDKMLSIHF